MHPCFVLYVVSERDQTNGTHLSGIDLERFDCNVDYYLVTRVFFMHHSFDKAAKLLHSDIFGPSVQPPVLKR